MRANKIEASRTSSQLILVDAVSAYILATHASLCQCHAFLSIKMGNQGQSTSNVVDVLPPWAVDPEVKSFLESEGIELVILLDEKFRRGSCSMPLIVLRRTHPPNQYYLYVNE